MLLSLSFELIVMKRGRFELHYKLALISKYSVGQSLNLYADQLTGFLSQINRSVGCLTIIQRVLMEYLSSYLLAS